MASVEVSPATEHNLGSMFLELWACSFCLQMSISARDLAQGHAFDRSGTQLFGLQTVAASVPGSQPSAVCG